MPATQSFAAALAIGLVLGGAYMLLTMKRRFSRVVVVLLSVPIPAAGLALYALYGGPPPQRTWQNWLASAVVVIAIVSAVWRAAVRPSSTVTISSRANFNRYVLGNRGSITLWITAYAATFVPLFAIANFAVIFAWIAFCIPRRWRRGANELSVDLAARPADVFRFLVEPANWPLYQDIEEVTVRPAGPLRVGSEVTARTTIAATGPRAKAGPTWITFTTRITALDPGASFTAATVGRDEQVTTEVRPSATGTRLTRRVDRTLPLTDAIMGMMLEYRADVAGSRKASPQVLQSLDELIPSTTRRG